MIHTSSGSPEDVLLFLWSRSGTDRIQCISCHTTIDPKRDVLARTYCFKSHLDTRNTQYECSSSISISELNDELVLFDRHLGCLLQSTKFVAVSHVWHRIVASGQSRGPISGASLGDVGRTVCQAAHSTCRGITAGLAEAVELWHDYVSVPQWQHDRKARIIPIMPQIYSNAALAVVYAADLDHSMVSSMRQGSSVYERCRAISDLCNMKWFSRVWTAMEYTQPRCLRFMTKDYVFVAEDSPQSSGAVDLFQEMQLRWRKEVARQNNGHALEDMVGMGYNLVPWQLGPLASIRSTKIKSQVCTFALAHQVFARRGVTNPRDFFSVLLASLDINMQQATLSEDPAKALLEVAQICVLRGDLSPIFMAPAWVHGLPDAKKTQSYGYNDLATFGLGDLKVQAPLDIARYDSASEGLLLTAFRAGDVKTLVYQDLSGGMLDQFADVVRQTIEVVGDNLESFVCTVGGRLYGQDTMAIMRYLSLNGRRTLLSTHLKALHAIWSGSGHKYCFESDTKTIIIALVPRVDSRSQDLRFEIDLQITLGNENGRFCMLSRNFHTSARSLNIDGSLLTAELQTIHGGWHRDSIEIRRLVATRSTLTNDLLDSVAELMGLSNRALESELTPLTPLKYLMAHGMTIHLGAYCAIVRTRCASCGQDFLLRAAMFSKVSEEDRLVVWRIPYLQYKYTFAGGTGVLVSARKVVGRFIWGNQTCECSKLEELNIALNDIPLPRPNRFDYGWKHHAGRLIVHLEMKSEDDRPLRPLLI